MAVEPRSLSSSPTNGRRRPSWRPAAILGALGSSVACAGVVDVGHAPPSQTVFVGDVVSVQIVVSTPDFVAQPWDGLDAVITWDPAFLQLTGSTQLGAGAAFLAAGFLPDPDAVNASLVDGDAIFTALAPTGAPVLAPPSPGALVVTTLEFMALAPTPGTPVDYLPSIGLFGHTAVYLNGALVTGDASSVAIVKVIAFPCPNGENCFAVHAMPGCSNAVCCELVCDVDIACCEMGWDLGCKDLANGLCTHCGEPDAGDCAEPHLQPGCDNLACCRIVCALDQSCCEITWDLICAAEGCTLCAECFADLSPSGVVDGADLGILLANWGGSGCGDLNFDGVVDGADLGLLLAVWGPCP